MANKTRKIINQSAVIPYKIKNDKIKILIITSMNGKNWGIPKGVIEKQMSASDSAGKEAFEEAGIKGRISKDSIGFYAYKKWGGTCVVQVFPMLVTKEYKNWPEFEQRDRKWISIKNIHKYLFNEDLSKLIFKLKKSLN